MPLLRHWRRSPALVNCRHRRSDGSVLSGLCRGHYRVGVRGRGLVMMQTHCGTDEIIMYSLGRFSEKRRMIKSHEM